jgi:hypothetical protein
VILLKFRLIFVFALFLVKEQILFMYSLSPLLKNKDNTNAVMSTAASGPKNALTLIDLLWSRILFMCFMALENFVKMAQSPYLKDYWAINRSGKCVGRGTAASPSNSI